MEDSTVDISFGVIWKLKKSLFDVFQTKQQSVDVIQRRTDFICTANRATVW